MMGRSLRVSPGCIEQVKSAVGRNGFPTQKALAEALEIGLSTIKKFLTGQPVDYSYFLEISGRLGYEWRKIVHIDETIPKHIFEETSVFITGTPITDPRYFFGRHKGTQTAVRLAETPSLAKCCDYRQATHRQNFFAAILEKYYHHTNRTVAARSKI